MGFTPLDTPKLNEKIEHAFTIRWGKVKFLIQNTNLLGKVNMNKKVMTRAITTFFLH